jgi:hypothetical protein
LERVIRGKEQMRSLAQDWRAIGRHFLGNKQMTGEFTRNPDGVKPPAEGSHLCGFLSWRRLTRAQSKWKGTTHGMTDTKLKALKPKAQLFSTADGGGLFIEVTPKGPRRGGCATGWRENRKR